MIGEIRECNYGCGCKWRDNGNGTMSLADADQRPCMVCEFSHFDELNAIDTNLPHNCYCDIHDIMIRGCTCKGK